MWLEEAGNISCANGILGPTPIFVVVNIIPWLGNPLFTMVPGPTTSDYKPVVIELLVKVIPAKVGVPAGFWSIRYVFPPGSNNCQAVVLATVADANYGPWINKPFPTGPASAVMLSYLVYVVIYTCNILRMFLLTF
jgi:hypothetical protein